MVFNPQIHPIPHLLKSIIGHCIAPWMKEKTPYLKVLNYHGTQKKYLQNFRVQLDYYTDHFEIVSALTFDGGQAIGGKQLLLTFDDGIRNNLYAIEELDKRNLSAFFFIVPQFVDTPIQDQKRYFTTAIRPVINPALDDAAEDFESMNWDDLRAIARKHRIGCHTATHTLTRQEKSQEILQHEIIDSKAYLEQQLGQSIQSFCSINNTLLSINSTAKQLIDSHYQFHFTTFGGCNQPFEPLLIQRINVESHWLQGAVKFALSPIESKRWQNHRMQYCQL